MTNRIKEQQLGLFADRTSCHDFLANQFRLMLSSAAYVLVDGLRRLALAGTEMAAAQVQTIRVKLLKVGARVKASVRRVVFHLAGGYPLQHLFRHIAARLQTLLAAQTARRHPAIAGIRSRGRGPRHSMMATVGAPTNSSLNYVVAWANPNISHKMRIFCLRDGLTVCRNGSYMNSESTTERPPR